MLLRVSCWIVMNANWKAMIRLIGDKKIRKQGFDPKPRKMVVLRSNIAFPRL